MNAGILATGYAAPLSPRPLLGLPQPVPTPYQIGPTVDPFWSNVSLLLPMLGRNGSTTITDASTRIKTITRNGPVFLTERDSATGTTSCAFNGSSTWLSLASNSDLNFGTGDFTVEMWLKTLSQANSLATALVNGVTSFASGAVFFTNYGPGAAANVRQRFGFGIPSANPMVLSTTLLDINRWYHVAVTRSGTLVRLFINGTVEATATNSAAIDLSLNGTQIGRNAYDGASSYWNGYIEQLRITKGVARSIVAIPAPLPIGPTTTITRNADPFFSSVSLLLRMDGQNGATSFPDLSNNALVATVSGNTQTSTADSPFGGASGLFDGTADFLQYSDTTPFDLTGDFTIEFWVKTTSTKSSATVFSRRANSAGTNIVAITLNNTVTGDAGIFIGGTASFFATSTGSNVCDGQWHHFATTRTGNTLTVFVDGVSRASSTSNPGTISFAASVPTQIGRDRFYTARDFDGRLAEFRVTRGVARYSATFTPPTSPFPGY